MLWLAWKESDISFFAFDLCKVMLAFRFWNNCEFVLVALYLGMGMGMIFFVPNWCLYLIIINYGYDLLCNSCLVYNLLWVLVNQTHMAICSPMPSEIGVGCFYCSCWFADFGFFWLRFLFFLLHFIDTPLGNVMADLW